MRQTDCARTSLVVIGCGHQSARSHLPVLAEDRNVHLEGVIDTEKGAVAAKERLERFGFQSVPVWPVPEDMEHAPKQLAGFLEDKIRPGGGAIVSTPAIARLPYLAWLLDNRIPTLAEKPPIMVRDGSSRISAAKEISRKFKTILTHPFSDRLYIAAQRRYNPVYHFVADHCRQVFSEHGQPITFIQAATNDGLWADNRRYDIHDPSRTGGGKLINTGYHLLDLVPWIIRHACPQVPITRADILTHAMRAENGFLTDGELPLNEMNAAVQVAFKDQVGRVVCLFQLSALHGGLSRRAGSLSTDSADAWQEIIAGRTKQETLSIFQGAHSAVWLRRLAKLNVETGTAIGSDRHMEIVVAQNPAGQAPASALRVFNCDYDDDDFSPTREFVQMLRSGCFDSLSPVRDHSIAMSLLSGAYQSMITGKLVQVSMTSEVWSSPPGCLNKEFVHDARLDKSEASTGASRFHWQSAGGTDRS